jgi:FkbH-like protein
MPRTARTGLRAAIDGYIEAGDFAQARSALQELWMDERSPATASYVISCYERLRPYANLAPCRLAILRSFTLEPAVPVLRAAALLGGIDITALVTDFDNYSQQILDPASSLYSFNPDVVIFAVQTRDIAPDIWESFTDLTNQQRTARAEEWIRTISEWVRTFRSRTSATLLMHSFEVPAFPSAGVLDAQSGQGQAELIREVNRELQKLTAAHPGVHVLDYDGLVSRRGRDGWHDERKWLTMRMPIGAENLAALAREWLRFLHPLTGRIGKVLVTDLDNTLWGGVVGEDGIKGLQIGREYPGAGYLSLQRVLLDLHHRGILLAISSKNNEEEALEALSHPEMLLRPEHFAAIYTNWNSKHESLRQIAEELNVGLDSLVFVDDNPTERQSIRIALPEVTVVDLPADHMGYAKAVRECPLFERLVSSTEDRERSRYYVEQRQRRDAGKQMTSLEDFYRSLEQRVEIVPLTKDNLGRVAELIKKTNQFNLTTKRHSEAQIAAFADDPNHAVYAVRVADRFGDNGLVGVCVTRREDDACEIDTFLLSCRVIGRTVETAVLSFLAEESQARGLSRLEGWFLPTRKNKPSESVYPTHGFELRQKTDAGTQWALNLQESTVACPPWIQLVAQGESVTQ